MRAEVASSRPDKSLHALNYCQEPVQRTGSCFAGYLKGDGVIAMGDIAVPVPTSIFRWPRRSRGLGAARLRDRVALLPSGRADQVNRAAERKADNDPDWIIVQRHAENEA